MSTLDHIKTMWYFVRTRQVTVFFTKSGRQRFIGPHYVYYDGPHYGFGLWFITISAYGFKDRQKGLSRFDLVDFTRKLIGKRSGDAEED